MTDDTKVDNPKNKNPINYGYSAVKTQREHSRIYTLPMAVGGFIARIAVQPRSNIFATRSPARD